MKIIINFKSKILLFSIITAFLQYSCSTSDLRGFEFSNFQNTPLEKFAIAVKNDDIDEINSLIKSNKYDINYKDPINQQTLLSLAIVNHKKNAFLKLLRLGADPNLIIGQLEDSSALSEAIKMSQKWKMFYIANLLKNKANPNLLIIPKSQNYFSDYYPIFTAIVYSDNYDVIQLLVNYGADINVCNPHSISNVYCDGVLQNCLDQKKMLLLRYFIIEAKIKIPKIVYFKGGFDEKKQKEFSLTEILNTEEYKFEDFEEDGAKTDFSEYRRYRLEIIQYLKKTRQY